MKLLVAMFLIFMSIGVSASLIDHGHTGGSYAKSINILKHDISLMERRYGQYDLRLATALGHLGSLYYEVEQYDLAMDIFRRAQHLVHRADGVYSLHQLGFVHWITKVKLKTHRFHEADVQQRFSYYIQQKNYGMEDPKLLPAMNQFGIWLKRTGRLNEALTTFRQASILSKHTGAAHFEKLITLRSLSSVLFLKGICCPDKPLTELLNLVRRYPEHDQADEVESMIHLADMKMMGKNRKQAYAIYEKVWEKQVPELFLVPVLLGITGIAEAVRAFRELTRSQTRGDVIYISPEITGSGVSEGGKKLKQAEKLLGEPLSLCYSQVLNLTKGDVHRELDDYYLDLNFSVSEAGKVSNVTTLDGNMPVRLERYIKNVLSKSRFRPRIVDGLVVSTQHVSIHQTFINNKPIEDKNMLNRQASDSRQATSFGCQLLATGVIV